MRDEKIKPETDLFHFIFSLRVSIYIKLTLFFDFILMFQLWSSKIENSIGKSLGLVDDRMGKNFFTILFQIFSLFFFPTFPRMSCAKKKLKNWFNLCEFQGIFLMMKKNQVSISENVISPPSTCKFIYSLT